MDYMLPDIDGLELCKKLRKTIMTTPILILTGKLDVKTKVNSLNAGADDYIVKPFHFEELLARIHALLRRPALINSTILNVGDLSFDIEKKIVKRNGQEILLRRKELLLLEYLMRHTGRVISREMILESIWESENDSLTNIVDVHINYLRDKIDKTYKKKLIKTVHGLGYKIDE